MTMTMINAQRKCIATNKVKDITEMIRIVKTKSGTFHIDSNEKGRGAYITRSKDLIEILLKRKLLNRSFKTSVPNEVYEELKRKMEE